MNFFIAFHKVDNVKKYGFGVNMILISFLSFLVYDAGPTSAKPHRFFSWSDHVIKIPQMRNDVLALRGLIR